MDTNDDWQIRAASTDLGRALGVDRSPWPPVRIVAYCYGTPLDLPKVDAPDAEAKMVAVKELMGKHIREECDGGAAPWAADIHWHEGKTPEGYRLWAAASGPHLGGSWLNHQIVAEAR